MMLTQELDKSLNQMLVSYPGAQLSRSPADQDVLCRYKQSEYRINIFNFYENTSEALNELYTFLESHKSTPYDRLWSKST
jgi:hypothetical protein